jgi:hypothetical protein
MTEFSEVQYLLLPDISTPLASLGWSFWIPLVLLYTLPKTAVLTPLVHYAHALTKHGLNFPSNLCEG